MKSRTEWWVSSQELDGLIDVAAFVQNRTKEKIPDCSRLVD
jgi:hypothetical protein